jgi:hypothetical protein
MAKLSPKARTLGGNGAVRFANAFHLGSAPSPSGTSMSNFANWHWMFPKKAEFRLFSFSSIISTFLKTKMNIQSAHSPKDYFTNPEKRLRAGRLQRSSLPHLDGAEPPPACRQRIRKVLLSLALAAILAGSSSSAIAQLANINPIKDNTLYQYDPVEGDVSNALGQHFFAGETGMGELRRGVLAFDIAGNVPAGSTILGVTLSLNMSRTPTADPRTVELHRLLADWGEGTSVAPGEEGEGAPATTNDATWRHRFFDTIFWTTEGGDFSATVSASQSVGTVGVYTWSSSQMRADVQSWLDDPASNFGWLVLGDESEIVTAKRFDTRESASPPVLTIQFRPPGPRPTPTPRPRPTPYCGRIHCGPPTPAPTLAPPRSTSGTFSHPLLYLLRLFALLSPAQSALPPGN